MRQSENVAAVWRLTRGQWIALENVHHGQPCDVRSGAALWRRGLVNTGSPLRYRHYHLTKSGENLMEWVLRRRLRGAR